MKIKLAILILLAVAVVGYLGIGRLSGMVTQESQNMVCNGCNVVLIVVDTLRADHLSCYGYPYNTSPAIDEIASHSVVFENAFSQIPFTPPSHWSLMTGLYPFRHRQYLPQDTGENLTTLAELLKARGYSTAAFVSSFMVRGIKKGFDIFELPMNVSSRNPRFKAPRNATATTDAALKWLSQNRDRKFFLFVHYFDVHSPYRPPLEFDVFNYSKSGIYSDKRYDRAGIKGNLRDNIAKYDGEILYVDSNIGRIADKVKEYGIENKTVFIITSDHGECFGEHSLSEFGYKSTKHCLFHGKTLFDEEVHVPLVVYVPGVERETRVKDIVELVDVMPAVMRLLGFGGLSGIDGRGLGISGGVPAKGYAIMQTLPRSDGSYNIGIRNGEVKVVRQCRGGGCSVVGFSVPGDVRVVRERQDAAHMESVLEDVLSGVDIGPVNFTISKSLKERLKKQGYIA